MPLPRGLIPVTDNEQEKSLVQFPTEGATPGAPAPSSPVVAPQSTPVQAPSTLPPGLTRFSQPSVKPPTQAPVQSPVQPEPDYGKMQWGDVITQSMLNIPESATQMGKDIATTVMHPIQTIKALKNVVVGAVQKGMEGEQAEEQYFDALVDFYTDRYGSIEGFKKAVAKDPIGVLSDGAGFLIPGGMAVKGLGTTSKVKALAKLGKVTEKVGAAMDIPMQALQTGTKVAGLAIPKTVPVGIYEKAVKLSSRIKPDARARIVQTALDENIVPSLKGLDKLRAKLTVTNKEISDLIDRAQQTGQKIPLKRLQYGLKDLHNQARSLSPKATEAQAQLKKITKDMYEMNRRLGMKGYTPTEVQALKQSIYKELTKYYENVKHTPMSQKVYLQIAKNARESLEDIFPELIGLNKQYGDYKDLIKALEEPISRLRNNTLEGLTPFLPPAIGAVGGGATGAAAGTALGLTMAVYKNPAVQAKFAVLANQLRKRGISLGPMWDEVLTETSLLGRAPARAGMIDTEKDENNE